MLDPLDQSVQIAADPSCCCRAMMGRLAVILNSSERMERKRRQDGVPDTAGEGPGADNGGNGAPEERRKHEEAERSVTMAGSAMREVAVASAPADAAAGEISVMLRERRRKKRKEVQDAFAGEYVPMNPLDWRAKGR